MSLLIDISLKNKKYVIDMGCGQGEMTCWMAQQINSSGIVVGVDISEEQLSLARQYARSKGIKNVLFIKKSILDADFRGVKAQLLSEPDLIYSRWLLIHLESEKILLAMNALYDLLCPGGVMVHEEVTLKESLEENTAPSFGKYSKLFTELAGKLNINFDLGSDLWDLFSKVGYQKLKTKIFKPKYTSEQLNFFLLDLKSALRAFEKFNIAQPADINKLCESIGQDFKDGFNMTMTNYFVYGSK